MKTTWSQTKIDDFINWHEKRMDDLNYPKQICKELRDI
jgi:hypothetical protein